MPCPQCNNENRVKVGECTNKCSKWGNAQKDYGNTDENQRISLHPAPNPTFDYVEQA